jgi:N-acetylmuramoyl-L-alanine amidase
VNVPSAPPFPFEQREMDRIVRTVLVGCVALAACAPPPPPGTGPVPDGPPVYRPVSPALPPIPAVDGTLAIRVVHPTPGMPRPAVDSTFVYGSVGTGRAALEINGVPVPVAPNGAFLAYLPMPADGRWRLTAVAGGREERAEVAYRAPATGGPAPSVAPIAATYAPARLGTVTRGRDTLATGSDALPARPTPTGTYAWFLPRGARLAVEERRGAQYRVRLGANTVAWVDADSVALGEGAPPAMAAIGPVVVRPAAGAFDVRAPAGFRPFLVETTDTEVTVTVYGTGGAQGSLDVAPARGAFVTGGSTAPLGTATRYVIRTGAPVWGYRAWYDPDGTLVVRLRPPPAIDANDPLRGRRIVIDPGHPPAGTTGPTGLIEADANLAIALPLAQKLRARGAEVILTRTTQAPMVSATSAAIELRARVDLAVSSDAELLVSIHNNAFGEGVNPWRAHGTSTYWFHPASRALARSLQRELLRETGIRDIGALQGNLALARPTWLPSVLTEALFMPIPEQEAALRDPVFLDRLAEAHLRGIEAFLRERAGPR